MGRGGGGYFSGTKGSGGNRTVHGFSTKVNAGKQGKHIVGSKNYQQGKSIFYGSSADAQRLVDKYAGTGTWVSANKERVDFGKVIGKYVDLATGKSQNTTMGIIHYSKTGVHIVPSEPKK